LAVLLAAVVVEQPPQFLGVTRLREEVVERPPEHPRRRIRASNARLLRFGMEPLPTPFFAAITAAVFFVRFGREPTFFTKSACANVQHWLESRLQPAEAGTPTSAAESRTLI
jgi:hypothetical protein